MAGTNKVIYGNQTIMDISDSTTEAGNLLQGEVGYSGNGDRVVGSVVIPTVNNAKLTIQKNGTTVKTFTANASSDVTCNIIVPTKTSDISNDSDFITSSDNAATATKLATARKIELDNDFMGSANFDGSGDISIIGGFYKEACSSGNTANYPWHRIAHIEGINGVNKDAEAILFIRTTYSSGPCGMLRIALRTATSTGSNVAVTANWIYRYHTVGVTDVVVAVKGTTGNFVADVFLKRSTYARTIVYQIMGGRIWTLIASNEVNDTTASDKKTSTEVYSTVAQACIDIYGSGSTYNVTANATGNLYLTGGLTVARTSSDANAIFTQTNKCILQEYTAGSNYNLPSSHYYHIFTSIGSDNKYATQLALGMTVDGAYYRKYNNQVWGEWQNLITAEVARTLKSATIRPADANVQHGGANLRYFMAASQMISNKPIADDGQIMHLAWDGANGYDIQIYASHGTSTNSIPKLFTRTQAAAVWKDWYPIPVFSQTTPTDGEFLITDGTVGHIAASGYSVSDITDKVKKAGDTMSGHLKFDKYKGIFFNDASKEYGAIIDNGSNLWIGASAGANPHHQGNTYISAGVNSSGVGFSSIYISIPTYNSGTDTWSTTNKLAAHSGNVTTGDNNGQVKIAGTNVSVKGLGSAAYKAENALSIAESQVTNLTTDLGNKLDKVSNAGVKSVSIGASYRWVDVATLVVTQNYADYPIIFELSGRHIDFTRLEVRFKNLNGLDPDVDRFVSDGDGNFYIQKDSTSTWKIYYYSPVTYGELRIHRITGCGTNNKITVTPNLTVLSSDPTYSSAIKVSGWGTDWENLGVLTESEMRVIDIYSEFVLEMEVSYTKNSVTKTYYTDVSVKRIQITSSDKEFTQFMRLSNTAYAIANLNTIISNDGKISFYTGNSGRNYGSGETVDISNFRLYAKR